MSISIPPADVEQSDRIPHIPLQISQDNPNQDLPRRINQQWVNNAQLRATTEPSISLKELLVKVVDRVAIMEGVALTTTLVLSQLCYANEATSINLGFGFGIFGLIVSEKYENQPRAPEITELVAGVLGTCILRGTPYELQAGSLVCYAVYKTLKC